MSLSGERAEAGLPTPTYEQKQRIWRDVVSSTARIFTGGYVPNKTAEKAHRADSRGVGLSGGWGAGKSLSAGMEGLSWLLHADLIWILAAGYKMARPEFIYLAEGAISTKLARPADITLSNDPDKPCTLRSIPRGVAPDGSAITCTVETLTVSDYGKIAGRRPDVIIVCEPGIIDDLHNLLELVWGRLTERRGELFIAGTSDEASEEWYELHQSWQGENLDGGVSFAMPTWENKAIYPKGEDEKVFKSYLARYGMDKYLSHFGGIPIPSKGLVLRDYWDADRFVDPKLEWDTGLPVEIAIDPGYSYSHYSVAAIQYDFNRGGVYVIDGISEEGRTHEEIKTICRQRPWWPHVKRAVMDPYAGNTRQFGNTPAAEYWWPLEVVLPDPRPRVEETVQSLKEVMTRYDFRVSPRNERFLWEAPRWKQSKDGTPQKQNCDMLKAFGYWCFDFLQARRKEDAWEEDDNIVRLEDFGFGSGRIAARREIRAGIERSMEDGKEREQVRW